MLKHRLTMQGVRNRTSSSVAFGRISLLAALLIALGMGTGAHAQFDTASVTGTITDPSSARVSGAEITLQNLEKGTEQKTKSSSGGDYNFTGVQIGNYVIVVKALGFEPVTTSTFQVVVSARQRVDVPLKLSGTSEVVEVNSGATAIETDTSDRGQVIEQKEIEDLPLNGREYTDLALLAPGVQLSPLQDGSVEQRRGSFNVNGMRSSVNNFILDGLDNNSYQNANQGFNNQSVTPSVDGVQQFKIITSNYPAEYGRSGGSIVNVNTRSGSNRLRAAAYEYIRNTALDAYGPLVDLGQKPTLIQNQFGADIGGAIQRDKTFFFLDYEGYRQITQHYTTASIPTLDQRAGKFYNESGAAIPLKNPYTGVQHPDGVIPTAEMTPLAVAVMAALPIPTAPGFTTNFVQLGRSQNTRDLGDLRIDRYFGTRVQTFMRLTQQANHITEATTIPGPAGGNGNGRPHVVTSRLALGFTDAISSRAVLDTRAGITRTKSGKLPFNYGQPSLIDKYGVPLPIDPKEGTVSLNTQDLNTFTALGTQDTNQAHQDPLTINGKISYTFTVKTHTFSAGYEYLVLKMASAFHGPVYGEDTYGTTFDNGANPVASTTARAEAYSLGDFMYGARSEYKLSNFDEVEQNMRFHSAYFEDSWRARSNLTLNYGLRYEFTVPDYESNNRLANYDPATKTLLLAHNGSMASRSLVFPQKNNVAPRFGFAYSASPKFVWRGSYGISYIQFNRASNVTLEFNGPFAISTAIAQTLTGNSVCPEGSQSLTCFRRTDQGDPASMISPQTYDQANSSVFYQQPDAPTGYIQSYYGGFQVQLDSKSILDVGYVGSHGVHIQVLADINQAPPLASSTDTTSLANRRPIKGFNNISGALPVGFMKYNSLQVKVQRSAKGFFILNAFTWAQARDNASGDLEVYHGDAAYLNYMKIKGDAGISGYNQPLNDSLALNYTIPTLRSKNHALRRTLGGWRVTAINRMQSGPPIDLNYTPSTAAEVSGEPLSERPNIVGKSQSILHDKRLWVRDPSGQFIRNVFETSNVTTPLSTVVFGNSPRNGIRFVPRYNLDLGLQKIFQVRKGATLQFRAEAFNALNKTNWNAPNPTKTAAAFGEITSAAAARQIQFAFRLNF